jgi:signal transduction histidine kinase
MYSSVRPGIIDWLGIVVRWLLLIGLSAYLISQQIGSLPLIGTLLAGAVWNAGLSMLVYLDRPLGEYAVMILISDLVFANLLNYFTGLVGGSILWAGLLPVLTAAFFLQRRWLWLIVSITLLSLGGVEFLSRRPLEALLSSALAGILFLSVGYLMVFLRERIANQVRTDQDEQLKARKKADRIDANRQKAIYKLVATLSATLNYRRVLDTALDMCTTALAGPADPAEPLVSAVLLYSGAEDHGPRLLVGSARRFTPADLRISLEGKRGLLGKTIDEAAPVLSKKVADDPEIGRIVALRACRAAYCIPLRTGLDTYGVMLFGHQDEGYFDAERREILDIIGNQAMIAIQNARLYHDLELEKERMMAIQEEARAKLARDLHDGPTQSVAALAMRVNFARRMMDRDREAAMDELVKIEDLARKTTGEIRHMLFTLRPLVLESEGLTPALEAMAIKMQETFSQQVLISVDEKVLDRIEMSKQSVIFFIAEEAVNNARKHAEAEHVWVSLKPVEADIVLLEIKDDGLGFDPEAIKQAYEKRNSLGMVNMRERADLVNGALRVRSAIGKGTRVQVLIPLSEAASNRLSRRNPV